jgi:hypothetical protein
LQGEAKSLIQNLPVTTENFHVAWQLVTGRYSNKKLIAMKHIKQLCQPPLVSKGNSGNLRLLINHINTHRNALQALSLNVMWQELIINHLLLESLDDETHKAWELKTAFSQEMALLDDILRLLEDRWKALELFDTSQPGKTEKTLQAVKKTRVSKQTASFNIVTQGGCPCCQGNHYLYKCEKFLGMQPKQRHTFVRQAHLCFVCNYTTLHMCVQHFLVGSVTRSITHCYTWISLPSRKTISSKIHNQGSPLQMVLQKQILIHTVRSKGNHVHM